LEAIGQSSKNRFYCGLSRRNRS